MKMPKQWGSHTHPEAPPPTHFSCQCATYDWTEAGTNAKAANNKAYVERKFFQCGNGCDDAYGSLNK